MARQPNWSVNISGSVENTGWGFSGAAYFFRCFISSYLSLCGNYGLRLTALAPLRVAPRFEQFKKFGNGRYCSFLADFS